MNTKTMFLAVLAGTAMLSALGAASTLASWTFSSENAASDFVFILFAAAVGAMLVRWRSAEPDRSIAAVIGCVALASAAWRFARIFVVVAQTALADAIGAGVLFEVTGWFLFASVATAALYFLARRRHGRTERGAA
jgi:hypothetical protein